MMSGLMTVFIFPGDGAVSVGVPLKGSKYLVRICYSGWRGSKNL